MGVGASGSSGRCQGPALGLAVEVTRRKPEAASPGPEGVGVAGTERLGSCSGRDARSWERK